MGWTEFTSNADDTRLIPSSFERRLVLDECVDSYLHHHIWISHARHQATTQLCTLSPATLIVTGNLGISSLVGSFDDSAGG